MYRTQYGSHYHSVSGCHGAWIPCSTQGLTPCADCCGNGIADGTNAIQNVIDGILSQPDCSEEHLEYAIASEEFAINEIDWSCLEPHACFDSSSIEPCEMDADFMGSFRKLATNLSTLMNDYGYTDSDRFINEVNDFIVASILGESRSNHEKHGDDAWLFDQQGKVHPFESKMTSLLNKSEPGATFNDTTDEKIQDFRNPDSLLGLGVQSGFGNIAFTVVCPTCRIADELQHLKDTRKKGSRSTQKLSVSRIMDLGGTDAYIVTDDSEQVREYLKAMGPKYQELASRIIDSNAWRQAHGFAVTGEPLSVECERRISQWQRKTQYEELAQKDADSMFQSLPQPHDIDEEFLRRYAGIREAVTDLMQMYQYTDTDRFFNEVSDLRQTTQLISGIQGVRAGSYHEKNNAFDTYAQMPNGHVFQFESKISSLLGVQHVKTQKEIEQYPNRRKWQWATPSATFNDITEEKIAEYGNPENHGIVAIGVRTNMADCSYSICIPATEVASLLEQSMAKQIDDYKRKCKKARKSGTPEPEKPRASFKYDITKLMKLPEAYVVAHNSEEATRKALSEQFSGTYRDLVKSEKADARQRIITAEEYQSILESQAGLHQ